MIWRPLGYFPKEAGHNQEYRVFIHITNPSGWEKGILRAPLDDKTKEFWVNKEGKTHISVDLLTLIEDYVYPHIYYASYKVEKTAFRRLFEPSLWKFAVENYWEGGFNTPRTFYALLNRAHIQMTYGFLKRLTSMPSVRMLIPDKALNYIKKHKEMLEIEGNDIYVDAFLYTVRAQYKPFIVSLKRTR